MQISYKTFSIFFQNFFTEINTKITSASSLATTTIENKIPNVNDLVKKQIMIQKYDLLRRSILPHLIITTA